jgi:hypothetical protein
MGNKNFLLRNRTRVDEALDKAWEHINKFYDPPAFTQLVEWRRQGERSKDFNLNQANIEAALPLMAAVELWKNRIMFEYLMVYKPKLLQGIPTTLNYERFGEPPVSFTDIFLTINAEFRPAGWELPDVSTYQPLA